MSYSGALPPGLTGAPPNAGPAVAPHGAPGNASAGLSKIKIGLEQLQAGLPDIPMGTELHEAVLSAITKIGRHIKEQQDSPQGKMQALMQAIQKMRAAQPNQALQAMAPPGAPPPGAPPPMPPPQ